MRVTAGLLLVYGLATAVALAGAPGLDGALGVLVFRPVSSTVSAPYSLGAGLGLDLSLVYSRLFRLSIQVGTQISWGTPRKGSLAAEPDSRLFLLPAHGVMEYTRATGHLRPYGGAGAGVLHVREKVSFRGPLGEESHSVSTTRFSWTVMAGLEKATKPRMFVEASYQSAGTAKIEGQSGVSLATVQLKVGWRTRLK